MVTQVTSMSRNGVSDWIIQRVSAVVLAAYTLCVLGFVLANPGLDYANWSAYFTLTGMKVFTMLALLATSAHAWVGMWTIGSDYLQEHMLGAGAARLRFFYQIGSVLIILAYLIWGINILWGNNV
jgi:succinate dehydrogenase / fumarate reductase membrane anchor subunit